MKTKLFLLTFITLSTLLFGQTAERIAAVRKKVEAINTEKVIRSKN